MFRLAKRDQRHVKRPASQVIDSQASIAAFALLAVAMRKLKRRGGRLVQQAEDLKAANPRCLFGEEALIAIGVRGNTQHRFKRLRLLRAKVRMLPQFAVQRGHRLFEQQPQGQLLAGNFNPGVWSCAAQ